MTLPEAEIDYRATLSEVERWLSTYISVHHPDIGRAGPICPFVVPSQKNRSLEVRLRLVGQRPRLELMEEIALSSLREFELTSWQGRNPMLHSMVIVFPDLDASNTPLLDDVHARVKDQFVARGTMLGQFHEKCEVVAARNESFAVSKAPVPVLVIRALAMHDIFFLSDHPHWFDAYRQKFGKYFVSDSPAVTDHVLIERYFDAEERYRALELR